MNKDYLNRVFKYSPSDDDSRPLVRAVTTNARAKKGDRPGYMDPRGYVTVYVDGRKEYMHRVVYCFFNDLGFDEIDHIDRNKRNNLIENLRDSDRFENGVNLPIRSNNTSGCSGVHFSKKYKKWQVRVRVKGKRLYFGSFDKFEDAVKVRNETVDKYHKGFQGETMESNNE